MASFFSYGIFHSWLFYFMLAHFLLVVFLVGVNLKEIWRAAATVDKKTWLMLLAIVLFGAFLRHSEYWLGAYSDGYVAQEAAHLWVLYGQFVKACALGNHADCLLFEQVLAPPGFSLLIALAHLIFGLHSLNASVISAVLSSLTIVLAFLLAYLVFKKEEVGLYAALIFSFIPLNIINSQTGESRPAGLFFAGLAILFFILSVQKKKFLLWLGTAASVSYAIYVRQESYVLVPLMLVLVLFFEWPRIKRFFSDLKAGRPDGFLIVQTAAVSSVFLVLQLWVLRWLLFNNPYNSYPSGGWFALHFRGLLIQGGALIEQLWNFSAVSSSPIIHYNVLSSILFVVAIIFFLFKPSRNFLLILCFWGAYFLVYGLMFDGNINGTGALTGDYFRRSLMLHLPYAVMAGWGFYKLNPLKDKEFWAINLLVLFFLLVFLNFSARPHDPVSFQYQNAASIYFPANFLADVRASKQVQSSLIFPKSDYWLAVEQIPNDCLVIASAAMVVTNDYFKNNQRQAAQIDLINDETKDLFLERFKNSPCLMYLADYRCQRMPDFSCQFLEDHLVFEPDFKLGELSIFKARIKQ